VPLRGDQKEEHFWREALTLHRKIEPFWREALTLHRKIEPFWREALTLHRKIEHFWREALTLPPDAIFSIWGELEGGSSFLILPDTPSQGEHPNVIQYQLCPAI